MLPRLYVIADKGTLDARGVRVANFAVELRDAGVTLLQYRDKNGGPQEVLRAAGEISAVFAGVEATLVMNDRADLAVLAGWSAVHVGQGDLSPEMARDVLASHPRAEDAREWGTHGVAASGEMQGSLHKGLRPLVEMIEFLVGISTHDEDQVREADVGGAEYVAVGPVFATSTKLNAEPVVGLEGVRRARALTAKPLVAIGGITLENARSVLEAGADSVAVIGGMFVESRTGGEVARDFLARLR
jgi:thiamine-phosphate pyrophosphorylase